MALRMMSIRWATRILVEGLDRAETVPRAGVLTSALVTSPRTRMGAPRGMPEPQTAGTAQCTEKVVPLDFVLKLTTGAPGLERGP